VGSRTGLLTAEKNIFPVPGIEPRFLGHPARTLVAVMAELSLLVKTNENAR
jgi:hypothetical protein